MLKLILYCLMMTPFIYNSWILMNMIIMLMIMFFIFMNKNLHMLGYNFYIDNMSYGLIILSIWISFLMIISSPMYKYNNMMFFMFLVLWLMIFLIISFSTSSIMIFYICFESSLIPIMIIIMGWGYQPERINASYYLLFYTLFASMPMLVSIFFLYKINLTNIFMLMTSPINTYIYIGMTMAFLIKMPLFMFHFWLPKAHVEAPVSGSMILASILLKLGGYGLIRMMNIIYFHFYKFGFIWISISMIGSIMISILCMIQIDIKSMIAYSSVAHMGLVISGIMTMSDWGLFGSYYMMIGHGLCSSGLFCLANMLYERTNSRSLLINKGMLTFMPSMSLLWFLMSASNMSCPPTINLVGEIMIINSLMSWNTLMMILLVLSSFMSACYSLYMFSYTQHGMFFSSLFSFNSGSVREFFLIMMHWIPLNLIIFKLSILM
uniref:NADH-ubiquinone oxidoreductase chain 4 n=1 Tax=Cicadetta abscondita TaxID=2593298 RepID=A0A7S6UAE5_9HEMI|nr:NADH dehydrogenase subunit 4 [Cicadetta abscondita]QOW07736.1 NADH dehydrogenase subunit 4 [Cicadetta abscondita]